MDEVVSFPNPSQFLRFYEGVYEGVRIGVPVPKSLSFKKNVFFAIFTVQRGTAWVSFRQNKKMFDIFAGKVRSYKERFFLVKLLLILFSRRWRAKLRFGVLSSLCAGVGSTLALNRKISTRVYLA